MNCFGKNLTRIRIRSGMTQQQLAQALNVTRQAVSSWERGRTEPDIATLLAIGEALQVDKEELIFGRKTGDYPRFQKRQLAWTAWSFSLAMAVLLLEIFLRPYWRAYVNTHYTGVDVYILLFQHLLPMVGWVCFGAFMVSFVALFCKVRLPNLWRLILRIISVAVILPSALVALDLLVELLIPSHKVYFFFAFFASTAHSQPLNLLLFAVFPVVSGSFLFLSRKDG